jgi:hypothetical protein
LTNLSVLDGIFAAVTARPYNGYENFKKLEYYCRIKFGPPVDWFSSETFLMFHAIPNITIILSFDKETNYNQLTILTLEATKERLEQERLNSKKGW